MINEFKVITLCGSTRFKEQFLEEQKRLTLEGNVVIFEKPREPMTETPRNFIA
jgi:hypothetical protein